MQQPDADRNTRNALGAARPSADLAPGKPAARAPLPFIPVNPLLFYAFSYIARRRLRRGFRALRIAHLERFPEKTAAPLIVYLNHPSWWDPLTCIALAPHLIGRRRFYGPIDAESLKRYRIFRRLGLFPVEIDSPRGAAQFLRAAETVLRRGDVLGLTPQGRFTDARVRPPGLRPGLGALLARMERNGAAPIVVPLAVEYTFWDERLPEALTNVGEPIRAASLSASSRSAAEWTALLDERLAATQDELAAMALSRSAAGFQTLLQGRRGVAGVYGMWQWMGRGMDSLMGGLTADLDGDSRNGPKGPS